MKTITVYEFDELRLEVQEKLLNLDINNLLYGLGQMADKYGYVPDELKPHVEKVGFMREAEGWARKTAGESLRKYFYFEDGKEYQKK